MKNFLLAISLFLGGTILSFAQSNAGIGTSTPNPNAILDLVDTSRGFLVPRLTTVQRLAISPLASAEEALLIYDLDLQKFVYWSQGNWNNIGDLDEQVLNLSNDTLYIENGNFVVLNNLSDNDSDPLNEIQDLDIQGNSLTLSSDLSAVDLSQYLDNTDDQQLSFDSATGILSIEDGGDVDLNSLTDEDWAESNGSVPTLLNTIYREGDVGIGVMVPSGKLHVGGDLRVGALNNENAALSATYGSRLYFSGGEDWLNYNSDNSDPLWMARFNVAIDQSELRMNLGDNNQPQDKFSVGVTVASVWEPKFVVTSDGKVGIGTDSPASLIDIHGDLNIDGQKPIILRRYSGLGDSPNFNTGFLTSDYTAAVVGFRILDGDIDENGTGDMIQIYMAQVGANWHIRGDMRSHNNHENWWVDVMFISKHLSQEIGY